MLGSLDISEHLQGTEATSLAQGMPPQELKGAASQVLL